MSEMQFDISKLLKPGQMDYLDNPGNISYFGLTLTGKSHQDNGTSCQDAHYVRFTNTNHLTMIAAIADGVGSCALSNYGSSIAVKAAVSYLETALKQIDISKKPDEVMGKHIRIAMKNARDEVKKEAERMGQFEYSYQSTLTIAIYDGTELYYGHIGDDGIVALTSDGTLEMITERHKGEEASSVYPLQHDEKMWQVGRCTRPVDGFVMATDGVLDGFVAGESCNNLVYYPFMEPVFKNATPNEIGKFYAEYMNGDKYREQVHDDLTLVGVRNIQRVLKNQYRFDLMQYNRMVEAHRRKIEAALYPTSSSISGVHGTR